MFGIKPIFLMTSPIQNLHVEFEAGTVKFNEKTIKFGVKFDSVEVNEQNLHNIASADSTVKEIRSPSNPIKKIKVDHSKTEPNSGGQFPPVHHEELLWPLS